MRKNATLLFHAVLIVISVFLITACSLQTSENHQLPPKENKKAQTKTPASTFHWKLPITVPKGEFFKVGGWLSNDELLYITNEEQTSTIYSYNLHSGKSKPLFKSEFPVGDVVISPSKKFILIQAAPSTYEGNVTIIDSLGNKKFSQTIPSYELDFEWNPYQESQVLISVFQEDWSFQVLLVDIDHNMTKELPLSQPFLKWMDKDRLVYLNWEPDQQKLFAPLVTRTLASTSEQIIFPNVYQFSAFNNMIMTITVDDKLKKQAKYAFYDQKMHLIQSFMMPHLTKFSDWLVPFYDFNVKKQKFITFRPVKSTDADTYKEGFQLASYDISDGKSEVFFKGLENEPLALSPSGNACLYGNSFEKVMDLKAKKILDVVKE